MLTKHFCEKSPLGTKAPGFAGVGEYFMKMWKEAEARRDEWGCKSGFRMEPLKTNLS